MHQKNLKKPYQIKKMAFKKTYHEPTETRTKTPNSKKRIFFEKIVTT